MQSPEAKLKNPKTIFEKMAKVSRYNDHKEQANYGRYGSITTFKTDVKGISDQRFKQLHGDEIDLYTTLDNILSPTTLKSIKKGGAVPNTTRNQSVPAHLRKAGESLNRVFATSANEQVTFYGIGKMRSQSITDRKKGVPSASVEPPKQS